MVRPRSAKPLFPGSNPGGTSISEQVKLVPIFLFKNLQLTTTVLFLKIPRYIHIDFLHKIWYHIFTENYLIIGGKNENILQRKTKGKYISYKG